MSLAWTAIFWACAFTPVASLGSIGIQRDCERVTLAFPTRDDCRQYIDFMALQVRGDGLQMVMGTCVEGGNQ